jgi:hypothetical protein
MFQYFKNTLSHPFRKSPRNFLSLFLSIIILGGCSGNMNVPGMMDAQTAKDRYKERMQERDGGPTGKVQDGLKIFGSDVEDKGALIGVNSLLWRASLDTISFMPLAEADPFGGIIMTEWYINPNNSKQRTKITIYILDTRLRADALRVSLFVQNLINGDWVNLDIGDESRMKLEDTILTKARQMKQK